LSRSGIESNRSTARWRSGRLLFTLRALLRRVERFLAQRATADEQRWAARLHDDLTAIYTAALAAPGARRGLEAVDRRRAVSRKIRDRTTGLLDLDNGGN
jgi:hypothetical protein